MINFCPECGEKIRGDFLFCPSCGTNLKNISTSGAGKSLVVICENCGEENSVDDEICSGCGAKLEKKEIIEIKKKDKEGINKAAIVKEVQRKKNKTEKPAGKSKDLDNIKILSIGVVVLLVAVIILVLAGVFDKPETTVTNINGNDEQNRSSGVSLENIDKINALEVKVKADSSDTESLLQLAHLRNDSGLYERAIEDYKAYLRFKPEDADARVDMGVCYYNLGRYNEAINEMTRALKSRPDHQIAHLNLGIVNLAAGNLEKSREWLQKAVKINPSSEIGKRAEELLKSH